MLSHETQAALEVRGTPRPGTGRLPRAVCRTRHGGGQIGAGEGGARDRAQAGARAGGHPLQDPHAGRCGQSGDARPGLPGHRADAQPAAGRHGQLVEKASLYQGTANSSVLRAAEVFRPAIIRNCPGLILCHNQILEHPNEHGQALEAVAHHQSLFAHPPGPVAGDRGVHSAETEERLKAAGVKCVAIPAAGKLSPERQAMERSRPWRRGYRWRAGIQGRIASLRRDFGWRKSTYHGQNGMERWLGLGVIASNLRRIALAK